MNSDPFLRRWYLKFNAKFFGGELPMDTEVWYQASADLGNTFEIHPASEGEPATLGITVDPCIMGLSRVSKLYLAHEMVHVLLWPQGFKLKDHGKRFDEEIRRLCQFRDYRKLL